MSPARSLRVVLYGDGQWAADVMEPLARGGHTIVAAVLRSAPSDAVLADAAARAGIPVLAPADINADDTVREIAKLGADLGLSVAYNQILRGPIRQAHRLGVINVHAGKLPYYRGRNIINWAIINGESEIGLTVHFIDDGIDTGDIIKQITIPIGWTDGYGDVLGRVVARVPALVVQTVEAIAAGTAQRRPQAHLPGTYFAGRGDGDEWIDWTDTSRNIHNFVRAITRPGPGARTVLGGDLVIVWRAQYDPAWPSYRATPGQIVGRSADGALVKTGDSTILVQEVEDAAGAGVPKWRIGTRLEPDRLSCIAARPVAHVPR